MDYSDARALRARQATADVALDIAQARTEAACADARLVQTTTVTAYPTTAGSFYACNPCQISGVAAEGNAASYVPDTSTIIYCWNAGSQVPPSGTNLIVSLVGGRWTFRYDLSTT